MALNGLSAKRLQGWLCAEAGTKPTQSELMDANPQGIGHGGSKMD
jgi:hypothetical protein